MALDVFDVAERAIVQQLPLTAMGQDAKTVGKIIATERLTTSRRRGRAAPTDGRINCQPHQLARERHKTSAGYSDACRANPRRPSKPCGLGPAGDVQRRPVPRRGGNAEHLKMAECLMSAKG